MEVPVQTETSRSLPNPLGELIAERVKPPGSIRPAPAPGAQTVEPG
jgi:hypothetical protein